MDDEGVMGTLEWQGYRSDATLGTAGMSEKGTKGGGGSGRSVPQGGYLPKPFNDSFVQPRWEPGGGRRGACCESHG